MTPCDHPAALSDEKLLAECRRSTTRRSGPGGQNRNKVETAVILEHLPTGLRAEANERRAQGENQAAALFRLRLKLALEVRRPPAEPSALWRSRVRDGKIAVNEAHRDFPAILAEALDRIAAAALDLPVAAAALDVTASQLVKLLKKEPRALQWLNAERVARQLPPLR